MFLPFISLLNLISNTLGGEAIVFSWVCGGPLPPSNSSTFNVVRTREWSVVKEQDYGMATASFLYVCLAKVRVTSAKLRAGEDCCFIIQRESENWVTSCSPEFAFRAVWLQMVAMCRMDFICYGLNICVLLCCERPIFLLVQCLCSLLFLHCIIPPFLSSVPGAVVKEGLGQAHKKVSFACETGSSTRGLIIVTVCSICLNTSFHGKDLLTSVSQSYHAAAKRIPSHAKLWPSVWRSNQDGVSKQAWWRCCLRSM